MHTWPCTLCHFFQEVKSKTTPYLRLQQERGWSRTHLNLHALWKSSCVQRVAAASGERCEFSVMTSMLPGTYDFVEASSWWTIEKNEGGPTEIQTRSRTQPSLGQGAAEWRPQPWCSLDLSGRTLPDAVAADALGESPGQWSAISWDRINTAAKLIGKYILSLGMWPDLYVSWWHYIPLQYITQRR